MQFVPQTGTKDDDPKTRKLIRRHVMLRKNEGRTPNNLKQPTQHGTSVFRMNQPSLDSPRPKSIPRRVGTDFSGLDFADDVAPPLMNETLQFCTVTNESLFVLEPCIFFGSEDPVAMCLQPLACDALYLNVMVFSIQVYMDMTFREATSTPRTTNNKAVLRHYGKSLSILRARIAGARLEPSGVSDITIMAVMLLAIHALVIGDFPNARFHTVGLNRLVNMKDGGVLSFKDKTKQIIEILR
jgi:hypothetical protein